MLLIACANVAGLGVTRALTRSDELWIQRALGASPRTLFAELILESALLAAAGAVSGIFLAAVTVRLVPWLEPPHSPNVEQIEIDAPVLAFALLSALAATMLSGLSAGLSARRSHRGRILDALVVGEIALAMVLLTGAGLCLRSFAELRKIDRGDDEKNVVSATFVFPEAGYPELEDRRTLVHAVLERVRGLPGVTSAATVLLRPFELGLVGWGSYLLLEGQPVEGDSFTRNPEVNFEVVTPAYFQTMGISLLEGRDFTEQDTDQAPRVAIVTRDLATRLWPGEPALGQRLLSSYGSVRGENGEPLFQTVVGVVEGATYRGLTASYFDLYVPYRQSNPQPNQIVVRTAVSPESLAPLLRAEISALDPSIAVEGMTTLEAIVERQFRPWRFNAQLFSFLGVTATLLAAVGLFGLLALSVRERTREIGIRAAIGATPADLVRAFVSRGLWIATAGISLGLGGSLFLSRFVRSLLYGVGPFDAMTHLTVMGVIWMTAFAASVGPASRATRISPARALRH